VPWETCQLVGLGDKAEKTKDLAEWDYGKDEGKTTPEIQKKRPGWSLFKDGPEGGETLKDVAKRAENLLNS